MSVTANAWRARLEYFVFLLSGSSLWWFCAYKVLSYLKFPFHLHPIEVYAIFIIPVVLLGIMLNITDRIMVSKED